MSQYSWEQTLAVERRGNDVLDAVFGAEHIIVKATHAHQRQKIDRFHIDKKDGRLVFRVDYKVDIKAGETDNLALEEVSVKKNGKVIHRGWIHTTIADIVVFYVPDREFAYVLEIPALRECWPNIQARFVLRTTSTLRDGDKYETDFYAVPIAWLRQNHLILKEITVIDSQMRLALRRA